MKNPLNVVALFLLVSMTSNAQEIDLKGVITKHNSKYKTGETEYVQNADVSAPFAVSTATDSEGKFELVFVGLDGGTTVEVSVEKNKLEVVNKKELLEVVIKRNTPLRIWMASKNQIAESIVKYNEISKKALYAKHNQIIEGLKTEGAEKDSLVAQLRIELNLKDKGTSEVISALESQLKEMEKKLPQFAKDLALKNLDYASEDFIKAFELFQDGKIDQAISTLEAAKLDEKINDAIQRIEESKEDIAVAEEVISISEDEIRQHIESKVLQAELLSLSFQYLKVSEIYQSILDISAKFKVDKSVISEILKNILFTYYMSNSKDKWLHSAKLTLEYIEKDSNSIMVDELINIYHNLASGYNYFSANYYKATYYCNKVISIAESIDKKHYMLGLSYSQMAANNLTINDYEKAIEYCNKAIEFYTKYYSDQKDMVIPYFFLAGIYKDLGNYLESIRWSEKAVTFLEEYYPDQFFLSDAYILLSTAYSYNGDQEKNLFYLIKAKTFLETNYPNYPAIGRIYSSLATSYLYSGNLDDIKKAEDYAQKSINFNASFGKENFNLATSHVTLGEVYKMQKKFNAAIDNFSKAIEIIEKSNPAFSSLSDTYIHVAECYQGLQNIDKSFEYTQKAVSHSEKYFPKSHTMARNYNGLAIIYGIKGDLIKALECYNKSIKIISDINEEHPDLLFVYAKISQVYFMNNDVQNANYFSEKAISISNQHDLITMETIVALSVQGACLMKKREEKEAIIILLKANEIVNSKFPHYGEYPFLLYQISICYMRLNQPDNAEDYAQKSINFNTSFGKENFNLAANLATSHLTLGEVYKMQKKFNAAIDNFSKAIEIIEKSNPALSSLSDTYIHVAECYQGLQNIDKSFEYTQKAVSHSEKYFPKSHTMARNYNGLAIIYRIKGNLIKALECYNKSIKIISDINEEHPDLLFVYAKISQVYFMHNDVQNANYFSGKAISISNQHDLITMETIDALTVQGACLMKKREEKEAIMILLKANEIVNSKFPHYGEYPFLLYQISNCYMRLNQPDNAEHYCTLLIQKSPFTDPNTLLLMGRIQRYLLNDKGYQENYQKALDFYYNQLKLRPDDVLIITAYIATCEYHLRKYENSLENIEKAENLANQFGVNNFTMWMTEIKVLSLAKLGRFEEAKITFEEFDKNPSSGSILSKSKAVYYALKDEYSNANKYLQDAVDNGFSDYHWIETEEGLVNIRNSKKYRQLIAKLKSN